MSCFDEIYGNEYYDFIVRNNEYLPTLGEGVCTVDGGNDYTILFAYSGMFPPISISNYSYNSIPKCYVPSSFEAPDASRILQVRQTPTLGLTGRGVLMGFLDSGIDTTLDAFLNQAGNSRVVAVWNQNYVEGMEGAVGSGEAFLPEVAYGRVYGPGNMSEYGNGDSTGHGTYVASVAAGSNLGDYSGAAPEADIAMVHLKEAKQYLKDYYFIPKDALCYQETDLILGVQFLNELAKRRNQSLVLCISVGTSMGSHSGSGALSQYLNEVAIAYRRCVVCATGNLAAARRHYYGNLNSRFFSELLEENREFQEVEVVVEEGTCGFVMEQWAVAPAKFQISMISPVGEILPPIAIQMSKSQEYVLALEGTRVTVDYSTPEATTGNQLIYYHFEKPSPGIWRIRVYSYNGIDGNFHMYLQEQALQCGNVFFLTSNPDTTIMDPGNAKQVLTVGGYNQRQNATLLESGRGYTIDEQIKPDVAAPGFLVDGAVAGRAGTSKELQYEARTGTSASMAVTAGAAAMYLQWSGQNQDNLVNTTQIKNAFALGAKRWGDELYPNRQWGFGALDLYQTFRLL